MVIAGGKGTEAAGKIHSAITAPAGDVKVAQGRPFVMSWSGTDADGDVLTYMGMASLDGGKSLNLLHLSTRDTSVTVPTKFFAKGSKVLLRVVASDGVNTAEAISSPVAVEGGRY
jgi:hypothetical protein